MPVERERLPEADPPRESLGELLSQPANHSAGLICDELLLAKQELREKWSAFRSGLLLMAMGALMGLVALIVLGAAVGAWQPALLIGALLALSTGVTAWVGLRRLQRTRPTPTPTRQTLSGG